MNVVDFGRGLLETGDLDPVYVMLHRGRPERLKRWLVAYWCFYHSGVASHLSEADDFWAAMERGLKTFPRGTERRHFRGDLAITSVAALRERYTLPELMVDYVAVGALSDIFERVKSHRGFGPWIAFKVADMIDRCLAVPVDFDETSLFLFKDPAHAIDVLSDDPDVDRRRRSVLSSLRAAFEDFAAPPDYARPVGFAEIETILCKWHSHSKGHYPLGKDSRELLHHLDGWGPLAERLKASVPCMG